MNELQRNSETSNHKRRSTPRSSTASPSQTDKHGPAEKASRYLSGESAEKKSKSSSSSLPLSTSKSWKNFFIRAFWSLLMIITFGIILWSGHLYVILMVIVIQMIIFKEVIDIVRVPWDHYRLPWFRTISWY